MKIITIGNQKGGVGKSTVACNFAVEAAKGGLNVLLVDADIQGSAMDFRGIRAANEKLVQFGAVSIPRDTIRHDVRSFSDFDLILIDAGGREGRVFRSAIMAADLFIIPVLPSPYDIWATEGTADVLRDVRAVREDLIARLLINQLIPNTIISREAGEALAGLDILRLDTVLHHRTAYKRSIAEGQGVTEYKDADGKAAVEMQSLWEEVQTWL
jgi:chromosome partitioning protein